eukprot:4091008-Pyramimonas_sp.AAC.1
MSCPRAVRGRVYSIQGVRTAPCRGACRAACPSVVPSRALVPECETRAVSCPRAVPVPCARGLQSPGNVPPFKQWRSVLAGT